ncbi:adenylate isopentenyltransferase-like [Abrus precatorius]|uniref:Adenylate isopentenyltransferase-like n=1 Tax=Abrus precatorius TaxID=3816 RepID=A0A8B8M2H6_ABRPR|nr:adenylate isopentenyltransferase-like [Abrus precatorius]
MGLLYFSINQHLYTPPRSNLANVPRWRRMDAIAAFHCRKDKVVVIMGATGTGKSRLSVDLASRFPFSEIINYDKMQLYSGLDITTNKIPIREQNGVPHHLLDEFDPSNDEFTASEFRQRASKLVADISSRRKLPILVGGSNSFIHALLVERFDPVLNVFDDSRPTIPSELTGLRYQCCFLWLDVSLPVLTEYLLKRVDDMLDSGMVDELAEFYKSSGDSTSENGLRKAIGVVEFERYFKEYPPTLEMGGFCLEDGGGDGMRKGAYESAVRAMKDNTCQLAKRQIRKILRLQRVGWDLQRVDATAVLRGGGRCSEIWEKDVLEPSYTIVKHFLEDV